MELPTITLSTSASVIVEIFSSTVDPDSISVMPAAADALATWSSP